MRSHSAFSLIELSIVLVILGLLVGGILGGQALIRSSELRKFTTDASTYITAIRTFQGRYMALPGDMSNATAFWGQTDANIAVCRVTVGSGTNTCNGDGDGIMETWEMFYGWKHLANAGLIAGQYTGVVAPGGHASIHHEVGVNCPRGMNNGCWGLAGMATSQPPGSWQWPGEYGGVYFKFGKPDIADPVEEVFTPEEAYLIDIKMDDSKPGTGKLITRPVTDPAYALGHCSDTNDTTATGTPAANYNLIRKQLACSLMLRQIM